MTEELLFVVIGLLMCGIVWMGHWIDRLRNENARRDERIDELMMQLDESDDELESIQDLNRLYENHFGKPLL
jgi:hypothetical protein